VIFPLNAGSVRLLDPGTSPEPGDFLATGSFLRVPVFYPAGQRQFLWGAGRV